MKNKKILIVVLGVIVGIVLGSGNVEAALQSNGGTVATKVLGDWLLQIRQMETAGGTLGLSESLNASTLLSTSTSNNLDIHMEKNTEYGAMAILSASSYGNPSKVNSGETTTGNKSGIYINLNKEWVSASWLKDCGIYVSANAKYKNGDTSASYKYRQGDAVTETAGWHGSGSSSWIMTYSGWESTVGIIRAYSGSLFSYYGGYQRREVERVAMHTNPYASRACIVVGQGF